MCPGCGCRDPGDFTVGAEVSGTACPSHKSLEDAIRRQEVILEDLRKDNAEHRLHMATAIGKLCERVDQLVEVKDTLRSHNQRRDDDNRLCDKQRSELWVAVNATNSRLDRRDGATAIIASVCSAIGAAIGALVAIILKHGGQQ